MQQEKISITIFVFLTVLCQVCCTQKIKVPSVGNPELPKVVPLNPGQVGILYI